MKTVYLFDIDNIERKAHPTFPRLPNHALMKMSSYYKKKGYKVNLICFKEHIPRRYNPDSIYIGSCLVSGNLLMFKKRLSMVKDGMPFDAIHIGTPTDYCPITDMPDLKADYSIYDEVIDKYGLVLQDYPVNIGLLTRGCKRHCSYCVNRDKNEIKPVNTLEQIYVKKGYDIELLDDNLFASDNAVAYLKDIRRFYDTHGVKFRLRNGLDLRSVSDEKLEALVEAKPAMLGGFHCAWDRTKNSYIFRNIQRVRAAGITKLTVHMLIGENINTDAELYKDILGVFYRWFLLFAVGTNPHISIFEDIDNKYTYPYYTLYKCVSHQYGLLRTANVNHMDRNLPRQYMRARDEIVELMGDYSYLITTPAVDIVRAPDFNENMKELATEIGVKHYDIKKELIK